MAIRNSISLIETYSRLSVLNNFSSIAWDFDNTLIDNRHDKLFYDFIENTPNKKHVIVTFRTDGWVNSIFQELAQNHAGLDETDFDGVVTISHKAWVACNQDEYLRKRGRLTGPLTAAEEYYYTWKGKVCSEMGLEVLVDDNMEHTLPGCIKYGIPLINSITLKLE
jgi:hypothetical protein